VILLIISVIGHSGKVVYEEKILHEDADIDPPQIVGRRGFISFLMFIPVAILVNTVPCSERFDNSGILTCENDRIDDFGDAMD